jgi:4-hydroxy-tetrahydrodipicolinate synthase
MQGFTGIWVPLVTPFRNQHIDHPALRRLAQRMVDAGVAGLIACGSTGEAAALSEAEQLSVLDTLIAAVPHCRVVMGLSGTHKQALLAQLEAIQARPIAGVLAPPPAYIRPSQAGLIDYFSTLAEQARVPIILYNIPYRTGIAMTLETIRSLAANPRITAIKDCSGDPSLTMQLIQDRQLQVLAGEDLQLFSTLCLGGSGAIVASAHACPVEFVRLVQLIESGQLFDARQQFLRLQPLIRLLFEEPNPAPIKAVLAGQNEVRNELRWPLQTASAELQERLQRSLAKISKA